MFAAYILCIRCGSWQLLGPSSPRFCERAIPWNWEGVTRINLVCFLVAPLIMVQSWKKNRPLKHNCGFNYSSKNRCQLRFLLRHGDADLLSMLENTVPPADASKISIFQSVLDAYTLKAFNELKILTCLIYLHSSFPLCCIFVWSCLVAGWNQESWTCSRAYQLHIGFWNYVTLVTPQHLSLMHPFPTDLCPKGWDSEPSEVVSAALGHDLAANGTSSQWRFGEIERLGQKVLPVYFKTGRVQVVAKEMVSLFHVKCSNLFNWWVPV